MDEKLLRKNLAQLKKVAETADVHIICALKGFSLYHLFPMVKEYLNGATASSLHEAQLIEEYMGIPAHVYCPVVIPAEFQQLQKLASHITFNSLSELARYRNQVDRKVSIGLRVNTGYSEITTELYNPASPSSRLGIPIEQIGDKLPDGVEGLHMHLLCENDSYTFERVLKVFEEKCGQLLTQCKWVNFGGGHFITAPHYQPEHLIQVLKGFKSRYDIDVILEPGSAVALNTGYLVATVLDIVHNGPIPTAMLDISFSAHLQDTLEMPYKPAVFDEDESGLYEYRLGGTTCLAGDFKEGFRFNSPLEVGQRIIFKDMMHYTMVKTTTFNGVGLPSIAVWKEDGSVSILKKFGYEDFKRRL
jgi:carboxynorspermidine decarboxylase